MDKDSRIKLLEEQLRRNRDQFAYYASNHRIKADKASDPDVFKDATAKAEVNEQLAMGIDLLLGEDARYDNPFDPFAPIMKDVTEFHEVFAPDWLPEVVPLPLTLEQAETRGKWVMSEGAELVADTRAAPHYHLGDDNMVNLMAKQADAFLDAIYFALGGLVRMKLSPFALWRIIHGQNMAKRNPDGSVTRRPSDGKVVKPADWVDPHTLLVAEIKRQIDAA